MKTIKKIVKPISYFLTILILFVSCTKYSTLYDTNYNHNFEIYNVNEKGTLPNLTPLYHIMQYQNNNGAYITTFGWKVDENLLVEMPQSIEQFMFNDYQTNINIIENLGLFTSEELNIVDDFADEIDAGIETNTAINHFISDLNTIYLSQQKIKIFSTIINAIYFFDYVYGIDGTRNPCARATVGLVLGFAGLCAGTASVAGAAIGAAGFIWASVEWGRACAQH